MIKSYINDIIILCYIKNELLVYMFSIKNKRKLMYNKVILSGHLTRDIEIHYTSSSMAVSKSAIATNRKYKSKNGEQKEEVCFVDISLFGRSAEIANQYLRKGSKVLIDGRLVFEQWSDKQTGKKRSKHSITVNELKMLDTPSDYSATTVKPSVDDSATQPTQSENIELDFKEEDCPF